jgi:hypothetical protein
LVEEVTWDNRRITSTDRETYNSLHLDYEMPAIESALIGKVLISLARATISEHSQRHCTQPIVDCNQRSALIWARMMGFLDDSFGEPNERPTVTLTVADRVFGGVTSMKGG